MFEIQTWGKVKCECGHKLDNNGTKFKTYINQDMS